MHRAATAVTTRSLRAAGIGRRGNAERGRSGRIDGAASMMQTAAMTGKGTAMKGTGSVLGRNVGVGEMRKMKTEDIGGGVAGAGAGSDGMIGGRERNGMGDANDTEMTTMIAEGSGMGITAAGDIRIGRSTAAGGMRRLGALPTGMIAGTRRRKSVSSTASGTISGSGRGLPNGEKGVKGWATVRSPPPGRLQAGLR